MGQLDSEGGFHDRHVPERKLALGKKRTARIEIEKSCWVFSRCSFKCIVSWLLRNIGIANTFFFPLEVGLVVAIVLDSVERCQPGEVSVQFLS